MKHLKKIMALVIAMVMMVAMSTAVFAYDVTITKHTTDKAAHTYGAYQIFSGTLKEETKEGKTIKTLSNIVWGSNVDSTKIAALITELNTNLSMSIAPNATAADIAKAISDKNMTADDANAQKLADAINKIITGTPKTGSVDADGTQAKIENLDAGYYFIKDTADVTANGAETRYILEVVSDVTTTEKASVPTVTKKVKDKNDSSNETTDWQDSADYDIGDTIEYQITGTLPSTFADYDTYKIYTIIDKLSAGLTAPDTTAVTIKVGDKDVTSHFDITVTGTAKEEQTMTIKLKTGEDLKTWTNPALTSASTFVVIYSATLNDAAVIAGTGNPNTVKLEFSNNPNYDSDGDKGTTPEDTVIVFTYKSVFNKVDGSSNPLKGAKFTLYKVVSGFALNSLKDSNNNALTANTAMTPATVTAITNQLENAKKLSFNYEEKDNAETTSFTFKGIDDGRYVLVETTTPDGYNTMLPLIFDVVATHTATDNAPSTATLTALNGNNITGEINTKDLTTGSTPEKVLSADIVNQSGSVLPSTGGIGTTIFYVIGAILVLGAGILLVTRRRVSAN